MTSYSIIQSGVDTSFSTHLNNNFFLLGLTSAINNWNDSMYSTPTLLSTENGLTTSVIGVTSSSVIDSVNTTALWSENGLVSPCDTFDLCNGSFISTTLWSTSISSSGTGCTAAITTDGTKYHITTSGTNQGMAHATLISSGASGLDMYGQNTEVLIDVHMYDNRTGAGSGGGEAHNATVYITDGTNNVSIYSKTAPVSSGSQTDEANVYMRVLFNSASNTVLAWTINRSTGVETVVANNISLASLSLSHRYIMFYTYFSAGSEATATTYIDLYCVGYRKDGAGAANVDYVSQVSTIGASSSTGLVKPFWTINTPVTSNYISFDSGAHYSGDTSSKIGTSTAGTGLKTKITVPKPTTISASSANLPLLKGFSAIFA